jgi:hypothetical protein
VKRSTSSTTRTWTDAVNEPRNDQGAEGWQQSAHPPHLGQPYGVPNHPKAATALVLGTLGLITCQVLSPFAWAIGRRAVKEIDASNGWIGGRSQAQTGYILGVIGTVILGLGLLFLFGMLLLLLVFGVAGYAGSQT